MFEIAKAIGARGEVGRQDVAVLVGNLIADQRAEIDQHLLVGCQHLLDLILLAPLRMVNSAFAGLLPPLPTVSKESCMLSTSHFPPSQ